MRYAIMTILLLLSIHCRSQTVYATVTCYNPEKRQCDGNPLQTADGSIINMTLLKRGKLRWCGVSRDLLKTFPFGSKIYVSGKGVYEVHDISNRRLKRTIDILEHVNVSMYRHKNIKVKIWK